MIGVDHELAVKILQDLVHIDSVNPDLVSGAAGEAKCAQYICDLMQSWGLEVVKRELAPGRHNAIGILRGTGGGRTLLFNGHMDTVSVEGMKEPFGGEVQDGKLYGRGAFDMKGSLAATLAATYAIVQSGKRLRGDVIFTYVADEEYASIGTEGIVADIKEGRLPRPDAAINTEPTGLKMGIGHKGFAWIEVETLGKAAHGSRPDLGVDAITQMGKVLVEISRLQNRLSKGKRHQLLSTGSIHASLVQGGRELSSYPDHCKLQVERRTVPPESEQKVANEFGRILEKLARADATFQATSRVTFVRNPWVADLQSDIVKTLEQSIAQMTGRDAETMMQTGWLDSALLGDAGIPTVVFGPSGDGAHAVVEWLDVDSLGVCAQVYADAIERFCG
jgi:acetylornithine deacetylase/succinyl-diaminopimelate desuccinylase family protein